MYFDVQIGPQLDVISLCLFTGITRLHFIRSTEQEPTIYGWNTVNCRKTSKKNADTSVETTAFLTMCHTIYNNPPPTISGSNLWMFSWTLSRILTLAVVDIWSSEHTFCLELFAKIFLTRKSVGFSVLTRLNCYQILVVRYPYVYNRSLMPGDCFQQGDTPKTVLNFLSK